MNGDHAGAADDRAGLALLRELALDLRWSWNHATDELWSRLVATVAPTQRLRSAP